MGPWDRERKTVKKTRDLPARLAAQALAQRAEAATARRRPETGGIDD